MSTKHTTFFLCRVYNQNQGVERVLQTELGAPMKTQISSNKPVEIDQDFNSEKLRVDRNTIHLLFEEIIEAQHAAHIRFSHLTKLKPLHDTDVSHVYYSDGRQKLVLCFEYLEHWFEVTQESLNPWGTVIECKIVIDGIMVFSGLYEKHQERYMIRYVKEVLQGRWIDAFKEVAQILLDFEKNDDLGFR